MYNLKKKKGITLIALIITVIIMLILAGVAISVITGDGLLFDKTIGAAETYNQSAKNEMDVINYLTDNNYFNNISDSPNDVVSKDFQEIIKN